MSEGRAFELWMWAGDDGEKVQMDQITLFSNENIELVKIKDFFYIL